MYISQSLQLVRRHRRAVTRDAAMDDVVTDDEL